MESKNQFGVIERVCMFCGTITPHDPGIHEEFNSCRVCSSTDFGIRKDGKLENPDGWMNKNTYQKDHGIPHHKKESHTHKCIRPKKIDWCPL